MKYIPVFLTFLFLSAVACKKDPEHSGDKVHVVDSPRVLGVSDELDNFDYAADEAAFLVDDTEGDYDPENSYIEDSATPMKIMYVTSSDSLPYWKPGSTTKKQKYGRRQTVFSCKENEFTITGYGFKAQSDTSRVEAMITKTHDTLSHACTIVSWSDTEIKLKFPQLTIAAYTSAPFSLKFKVFRSNDKLNKLPVSRTKSRGCIGSDYTGVCGQISTYSFIDSNINEIKRIRTAEGLTPWFASPKFTRFHWNFSLRPPLKKGDVFACTNDYAGFGQRYCVLTEDATATTADATNRPRMQVKYRTINIDTNTPETITGYYRADLSDPSVLYVMADPNETFWGTRFYYQVK